MMVAATAVMPTFAKVICEASSEPIFVDSRSGTRYESATNAVRQLAYNSAWVGEDATAEVVIADGATEVARKTGVGDVAWTPTTYGEHVLTYTTYIGGVAQDEVYTNYVYVFDFDNMGVAGLQRVTFTGSAYDASNIALGGEPIVTLDCEGMYDASIGSQTTYAYAGYMFMRRGETYTFKAYFDDYSSVMVDGKYVVAKNSSECKSGEGSVGPFEADGWHRVDFRVANNGGTGGPLDSVGIQYQTDVDTTWRKIEDDGSGTLFRTGPDYCGVVIVSARMRPSDPTIMDVVYKVMSNNETVKVRALAYEDGNRSFANAVPVLTFADGTGVNIGDNITPNEEHTISWQVAADWQADLAKVRIEIMVMEDSLIPIHLVTIPKTAKHAAIQYSDTHVSQTAIMNALLWLYASQDSDLLLVNGHLTSQSKSFELANGKSISNQEQTVGYLYEKMGYGLLSGEDLQYVNSAARINLTPSGTTQFAVKTLP